MLELDEFEQFCGSDIDTLRPFKYEIEDLLKHLRLTHVGVSVAVRRAELESELYILYRLFFVAAVDNHHDLQSKSPEAFGVVLSVAAKLARTIGECVVQWDQLWTLDPSFTKSPAIVSKTLQISCAADTPHFKENRTKLGGKARDRDALFQNIAVYLDSNFRSKRLDQLMLTLGLEAEAEPFIHEMVFVDPVLGGTVNGTPDTPYHKAIAADHIVENFASISIKNFFQYFTIYAAINLLWLWLEFPFLNYFVLVSLVIFIPFIISFLTALTLINKHNSGSLVKLVDHMAELVDFLHAPQAFPPSRIADRLSTLESMGAVFPSSVKQLLTEIISRQRSFSENEK
jgi:hypothetical protein